MLLSKHKLCGQWPLSAQIVKLWAYKLVELTPTHQLAHPLSEMTGSADEFSVAEETESKLMF